MWRKQLTKEHFTKIEDYENANSQVISFSGCGNNRNLETNNMEESSEETGEMSTDFEYSNVLEYPTVRGFDNDLYGNYYLTMPSCGVGTSWEDASYVSWSTDKINFYYPSEDGSTLENVKCKSQTKVFYKFFSFYGKYQ